jgi:hypothetical protein
MGKNRTERAASLLETLTMITHYQRSKIEDENENENDWGMGATAEARRCRVHRSTRVQPFNRPSGTGISISLPRHFVPGYDHPVPPGQRPRYYRAFTPGQRSRYYRAVALGRKPFAIEAPRIKAGSDTSSLSVHQRHHLGRITLPGDVDFLESSIGFFQIAFGELHR